MDQVDSLINYQVVIKRMIFCMNGVFGYISKSVIFVKTSNMKAIQEPVPNEGGCRWVSPHELRALEYSFYESLRIQNREAFENEFMCKPFLDEEDNGKTEAIYVMMTKLERDAIKMQRIRLLFF